MKIYTEYNKSIYDYYNRLPYWFERQPKPSKPRWIWLDIIKKELYVTGYTILGQYTTKEQKEREKQGLGFGIYQQWNNRSPLYIPYYKAKAKQRAEIYGYTYKKNENILTDRESNIIT